jgi:PIN domain nuclease of toxin-antitoxin system
VRALLDTNAFLLAALGDPDLPARARSLLADGSNEFFLSAVSAWEIAIKYGRRKLPLHEPPDLYVPPRIARLGLKTLPIAISHALHVHSLPPVHKDPFDRLLIAQAQLESLPILTSDANIARYDVEVIW